jgi:hypothetical protein
LDVDDPRKNLGPGCVAQLTSQQEHNWHFNIIYT